MFRLKSRNKQKVIDDSVEQINQDYQNYRLSSALEKNVAVVKELFTDVDILRARYVTNNLDESLKYCLL